LRRAQAKTIVQLRDYYIESMVTYPNTQKPFDYQELDENIVKSLLKQRQLAKESKTESFASAFDASRFAQLLYCEREMLRAITFMHNALTHIKQIDVLFNQSVEAKTFNSGIIQALDVLIQAIEKNKSTLALPMPSLNLLKDELQKNATISNQEDLIYLNGLLFSADILLNSLSKLARLYQL
jgi:hypothetical protein